MSLNEPVIYLDNAATSWPKPEPVYAAMRAAMREHGGNPGGSHRLSVAAQQLVEDTRQDVRRLFNAPSAERVLFTLNGTDALNLILKGLLTPRDRVLTGPFEHDSVARPLDSLVHAGASVTRCEAGPAGSVDLDSLRELCRQGADYVVMSHVSNVTGVIAPVREAAAIAHEHGALFILDAAQSAGSVAIDMQDLRIDALAAPGHKGLCGPMGTGVLVLGESLPAAALREGGTPNVPGIAGLGAGVRFIQAAGIGAIGAHAAALAHTLVDELSEIDGAQLVGTPEWPQTGVVSFLIDGLDVALAGTMLDQSYGIAVRAGLHCAPAAHRALGTFPAGTVRASMGPFNTNADVAALVRAVLDLATASAARRAA